MKKSILIIFINFVLVSNVFSYTVITDPSVFYTFFENPAKVLDFTELKDGTLYTNIQDRSGSNQIKASETDCINHRPEDLNAMTVGPGAFSNAWSFLGSDPEHTHSFCNTILWFDQGISTGDLSLAVSTNAGRSQPFAMYTNKGFMGIIPDTPEETLFIFENLHFIFSFEAEFSKTAPVSESKAALLAQSESTLDERVN